MHGISTNSGIRIRDCESIPHWDESEAIKPCSDLLEETIQAHGGDEWVRFDTLEALVSVDGSLFRTHCVEDLLEDMTFSVSTHEEALTINSFMNRNTRVNFRPNLIALEGVDEGLTQTQYNPRSSFAGGHRWDAFQAAYVLSVVLLQSMTSPFMFALPGFGPKEVGPPARSAKAAKAPSRELKIMRPLRWTGTLQEQTAYINGDGLVWRQDYIVGTADNIAVTSLAQDFRSVQGVTIASKTLIYAYGADDGDDPLVAIEVKKFGMS